MFADTARGGMLDRWAIGLSGLCLVHCLASAVLHEVGLLLAIGLGILALGRGVVQHGFMMPAAVGGLGLGVMAGALGMPHNGSEVLYTIIGVAILALGHDLNRRAAV